MHICIDRTKGLSTLRPFSEMEDGRMATTDEGRDGSEIVECSTDCPNPDLRRRIPKRTNLCIGSSPRR